MVDLTLCVCVRVQHTILLVFKLYTNTTSVFIDLCLLTLKKSDKNIADKIQKTTNVICLSPTLYLYYLYLLSSSGLNIVIVELVCILHPRKTFLLCCTRNSLLVVILMPLSISLSQTLSS